MESKIKELIKRTVGRRKKVFVSDPSDIRGGRAIINQANGSYTSAIIRGTIRRAVDPTQAIAEYARILRPGSPALFIIRIGPTFTEQKASALLSEHFIVDSQEKIAELPGKILFGFICKKR